LMFAFRFKPRILRPTIQPKGRAPLTKSTFSSFQFRSYNSYREEEVSIFSRSVFQENGHRKTAISFFNESLGQKGTTIVKDTTLHGYQFLKSIHEHEKREELPKHEGNLVGGWLNPLMLEAQLLLAAALKTDRDFVISHPNKMVSPAELEEYKNLLVRRIVDKEPMSYITGKKEFWTLEFTVTRDTLIPRPSTETLVDATIKYFPRDAPIRILDLGTGSGCLILSLLSEFKNARGTACDVSEKALAVAKLNSQQLGLKDRVNFVQSEWTDAVPGEYDLIVSNPPYITHDDFTELDETVKNWEPEVALKGGKDGLDCYRQIASCIAERPSILNNQGTLLLEIGQGQAEDVRKVITEICPVVQYQEVIPDLSGIERCVVFKKIPQK